VTPQITIIGGGSYQWGPTLIGDILNMPSLRESHIVLEDIDPAPLPTMQAFAEKMIAATDAKATVTTTTDQREALKGADFVVVTISTGGFASMRHDLEVPWRHGIRQSVGDSVGPGGISRSLRNIPMLVSIARDMEELCPGAWLLNITNPMTCLTRAVNKATSINAVGLCHEVYHFREQLAPAMGMDASDLRLTITGVNHLPIITAIDAAGTDGLAWLEEHAGEPDHEAFAKQHALKLDLLHRFGALPGAGDRHVAEFFPFVLTEESKWGEAWGVALTTIEDREKWQGIYQTYVKAMLEDRYKLPDAQSGEMVAPVIDSLITGTARELPLNRPNTGQAADLPADAVVETMCVVDGDGIRGREVVAAPAPVAEWARRHAATQELTVEAALSGDLELARSAFAADPLTSRLDLHEIDAMVTELLQATAAWLPPSLVP
jgi:alpha-galactosidase